MGHEAVDKIVLQAFLWPMYTRAGNLDPEGAGAITGRQLSEEKHCYPRGGRRGETRIGCLMERDIQGGAPSGCVVCLPRGPGGEGGPGGDGAPGPPGARGSLSECGVPSVSPVSRWGVVCYIRLSRLE